MKEIKTGARRKIKTEGQQSENYTLQISVIASSSKGQITKRNSNPVHGEQVNKIRKGVLTDTQHQPDFFLQASGTRKVLIKNNILNVKQ